MIRIFSNKTNKPNIEIESKLVRERKKVAVPILNSEYFDRIKDGDILFVKIRLKGLEKNQIVNQLYMNLYYRNAYFNIGVKVVKYNSTDISDSSVIRLAKETTEEKEVLDRIVLEKKGSSLTVTPGRECRKLDITNALKGEKEENSTIMIGIIFSLRISCDDFKVYSPNYLKESGEVCVATLTDISGLNGVYKYDEYEIGRNGKLRVNLATGKAVYAINLLNSFDRKMPITFSVYQNSEKTDNIVHLKKKLVPNFHYKVESADDYYILEDASGFRNYYKKIECEESTKKYVLQDLGIKHYNVREDVYISYFDYSYLYVINNGTNSTMHVYDKYDTHMQLNFDDNNARIELIESSKKDTLKYYWNGAKLEKIDNTKKEKMLFNYTGEGYLEKVTLPCSEKCVTFRTEEGDNVIIITIYNQSPATGSNTDTPIEKLSEVKLYFNNNNNELIKIEDTLTGQHLNISRNGDKVVTVGLYNIDDTENKYRVNYKYNTKNTEVTDRMGKTLYYYFDNYGKVIMIMDDEGRSIAYNYDEVGERGGGKLIGVSKVQNNARNLLENHSFENEEEITTSSVWQKEANYNKSKIEIVTGGIIGKKCLKITSDGTEEVNLSQTIHNLRKGTYTLTGFIKHPQLTLEEIEKIKIKVSIKRETSNVAEEKTATLNRNNEGWYKFEINDIEEANTEEAEWVKVTITANHISTVFYIDDLQLTDSAYITRSNLVKNGYMEQATSNNLPTHWVTDSGFDNAEVTRVQVDEESGHPSMLGRKVLKIAPRTGLGSSADVPHSGYRTISQEIPIEGTAKDQFIFSCFVQSCFTSNMLLGAFVSFVYENKGTKTYEFSFEKYQENWQVLTRSITAEDNYTKIKVGIYYEGDVQVLVDSIQLYKDTFSEYYSYDKRGNITSIKREDGTATTIFYDSDNKIKEIYLMDGTYYKYTYNTRGNLIKIKDLNGNMIEFGYDSDDRVTTSKITTKANEQILNRKCYDAESKEETITDEFGNQMVIKKDNLNRLAAIINSNDLETNYTYNKKSELIKVGATVNSEESSKTPAYNQAGYITTLQANSDDIYNTAYDTFGRVTGVKNGNKHLEQYQYDSLVDGYRKGLMLKRIVGENGGNYEFEYNEIGQVIKAKLNDQILAEYGYDENGNIYELKDKRTNITTYYTYDMEGKLIKMVTSEGDEIQYSYDGMGNIEKAIYKNDEAVSAVDYAYDYELNEYSREGYFSRIAKLYGDEIVVSSNGAQGFFGATPDLDTCSRQHDATTGMEVFSLMDNYDFISYEVNTFNKNKGKESWKKEFKNNKTFYMFVKPTVQYHKEKLLSFAQKKENGVETLSSIWITNAGKVIYETEEGTVKVTSRGTVKLNEWNLVGIKMKKIVTEVTIEGKTREIVTYKACIILNGEMSEEVNIDESVDLMDYLLVAHQESTTTSLTSSVPSSAPNTDLEMPLRICFMSFGTYNYQADDFKGIYEEGMRYLSKEVPEKSNATIYYDAKTYAGYDVITLNGTLKSAEGIMPCKTAPVDKSYALDKARLFMYDEASKKHVFGSYSKTLSLAGNKASALAYKLPTTKSGAVAVRFRIDQGYTGNRTLLEMISEENRILKIKFVGNTLKVQEDKNYLDEEDNVVIGGSGGNQLVGNVSGGYTSTSNIVINDENWHHLFIRYGTNEIQVYLDNINNVVCDITRTISLENSTIYLGKTSTGIEALNGCIEMLAYKTKLAENKEISAIFEKGKTIVVRNDMDTIGRIRNKKIIIDDNESKTKYNYIKTRITSEEYYKTISETNPETISYTYDALGNITSKTFRTSSGEKTNTYTYDKLNRLIEESLDDTTTKKYTYYPNGNIKYKELYQNNGLITKEEYIYDNVIKNKLKQLKNLTTNQIVDTYEYQTNNEFYPVRMKIKGISKSLTWQGNRLTNINTDEIEYKYNSQGIRWKKITPHEETTYKLEGTNIISMKKEITNETITLDFTYDIDNMLIGVTTSEGNYFYKRDITGNIIGC